MSVKFNFKAMGWKGGTVTAINRAMEKIGFEGLSYKHLLSTVSKHMSDQYIGDVRKYFRETLDLSDKTLKKIKWRDGELVLTKDIQDSYNVEVYSIPPGVRIKFSVLRNWVLDVLVQRDSSISSGFDKLSATRWDNEFKKRANAKKYGKKRPDKLPMLNWSQYIDKVTHAIMESIFQRGMRAQMMVYDGDDGVKIMHPSTGNVHVLKKDIESPEDKEFIEEKGIKTE